MILTVTLNAAVDKTYRVEGFALDRVHRPSEWRIVAGGKGINVARVYRILGGQAVATGFLGGFNGRFIADSLRAEDIRAEFVQTHEESRVCIAIVDPLAHTQTELNELGPQVTSAELDALRQRVRELLASARPAVMTLSGSLPPGVPDSIYAELIEVAREAGVRCALDASGEALRLGVAAQPWMVKPNLFELASLCGRPISGVVDAAEAAFELQRGGIEIVAVTLGSQGALCIAAGESCVAAAPVVQFVSAVGSGDSFLAAFLYTLEDGGGPRNALQTGVAAGAANAAVYGAGFVDRSEVLRLAKSVQPAAVRAEV